MKIVAVSTCPICQEEDTLVPVEFEIDIGETLAIVTFHCLECKITFESYARKFDIQKKQITFSDITPPKRVSYSDKEYTY